MARKRRQFKKPAIPQSQRTKNLLEEAEESFISLMGSRKKIGGYHYGPNDHFPMENMDFYYAQLEEFAEVLIKLVHLDNKQLHHPFVQWIINSRVSKDFLRKLHRGLEVGVKRGLENVDVKGIKGKGEEKLVNTIMVLNSLRVERDLYARIPESQPKSYIEIQKDLEHRGFIKHMSRQAFHKMALNLQSTHPRSGPPYNAKALPIPPKKAPTAWNRAQELIQQANTELEAIQKAFTEAQALLRRLNPNKPPHLP